MILLLDVKLVQAVPSNVQDNCVRDRVDLEGSDLEWRVDKCTTCCGKHTVKEEARFSWDGSSWFTGASLRNSVDEVLCLGFVLSLYHEQHVGKESYLKCVWLPGARPPRDTKPARAVAYIMAIARVRLQTRLVTLAWEQGRPRLQSTLSSRFKLQRSVSCAC